MRLRLVLTSLCFGAIAGVALFLGDSPSSAADKEPAAKKPALQKFMQAKLDLSQGLLEGLVTEDFDLIDKNAKGLLLLSIAEEWNVSKDPLYKQHSDEFRSAVKQISKMAQEKNLDGASLGFVKVTMSCIECHKLVRSPSFATQ